MPEKITVLVCDCGATTPVVVDRGLTMEELRTKCRIPDSSQVEMTLIYMGGDPLDTTPDTKIDPPVGEECRVMATPIRGEKGQN